MKGAGECRKRNAAPWWTPGDGARNHWPIYNARGTITDSVGGRAAGLCPRGVSLGDVTSATGLPRRRGIRHYRPPDVPTGGPAATLRHQLADARARGVPWDEAWDAAVAVATRGTEQAGSWRATFANTREAWEVAYLGQERREGRCFATIAPE